MAEDPGFQTPIVIKCSPLWRNLRGKVEEMSCEFRFDIGLDDEQRRLVAFFQLPGRYRIESLR